MPRYLFKLTDPRDGREWYGEWSTIVDAPTTMLGTRETIVSSGLDPTGERMVRVDAQGTSALSGETAEDLIACNRAGPSESCLSLTELIDKYRGTPVQ